MSVYTGQLNKIIDCDANPIIPKGWKLEEHIRGGQFQWEPSRIDLYLDEGQINTHINCNNLRLNISGNNLRERLADKPVLNVNVLNYVLPRPDLTKLIPEEWRVFFIFFWGTIYRDKFGRLCVRCLVWDRIAQSWGSTYELLDYPFGAGCPAALCK